MVNSSEMWWRLGVFAGLLCVLMIAEALWPRRGRMQPRLRRWSTNFGITLVNTLSLRLMGSVTAISTAYLAAQKGWGALNLIIWPIWLEVTVAVILLDLAVYGQHVITHKIPLLWRLHKVHHSDRDIDTTTALRFHPIEILLSMLFKVLIVLLLGPAVIAVLCFEIILNGSAMFNHSNLKIPNRLDKILRLIIVTPDMHRIHHSVRHNETDSNYGFFLPWWDYIFKTYRPQPQDGHENMRIGLSGYQTEAPAEFFWALKLPFMRNHPYIKDD